jgi:hypothetical protein
LRLKARAHYAQAVADTGPDLAVDRAIRHGPDGLAEGLDDLPEVGQPANPELPSVHGVLFSASGTFLVPFQCRNVVPHRETTGTGTRTRLVEFFVRERPDAL